MSLFLLSLLFFFGACMGSFLAVLIEPDTLKRSFWRGRSQCVSCKKILRWYELIPLVSYVLQEGRCRSCAAKIPRWIWFMEWYMAFLWMIVAMVLSLYHFSLISILFHIVILTGISLLVIEDIRFQTISDAKTLPLLGLLVVIFVWSHYGEVRVLFPDEVSSIIIGGFIGMFFYMIQVMLPALIEIFRRGSAKSQIVDVMLSPFLFLIWLIAKVVYGEKKADTWFPSLALYDDMPSWVGGGDIRLGLIIGLLVGPYDFLGVILYGYVLGTAYFCIRLIFFGERMRLMPVAPLLFFGLCGVWMMNILG